MTPPENGTPTPEDTGTPARRKVFTRRRTFAALAVLAGGGVALTACAAHEGGSPADGAAATRTAPATTAPGTTPATKPVPSPGDSATAQAREDAAAAKHVSAAKITILPKAGTTNAAASHGAKVAVSGGKLTSVVMKATATCRTVAGTMSADHTRWQPNAPLGHGVRYRIAAAAVDSHGRPAAANATFATSSAPSTFVGYFTPEGGSTVGVGMPISINFNKPIASADRAAVQHGVRVDASSGQQVVGHWFSSTRLDLRPQTYWQAGAHITLTLRLDGVKGAPGVYGVQHKSVAFDVGRSQVSTVDAATHMMTVVRDGQVIRTIPISAGGKGHTTYDGQMVIQEKDKTTRMNGATVGFTDDDGKGEYDIPDVPHAMRLSNSGTFIHGNYWAGPSVFGAANTSHGCIGLADVKGGKDPHTPAAWFFDHSLVGDVIVVKNSPDRTIQPSNGLNGWNLSWAQWLAGSAIKVG